ncbi:MAG: NAD(+) synthase [Clostridiales Family XIII bacterium]|jgi:NAD+ synthase (glutamine-hydrolysing)|nr:NAD(+) synthase [Clostridiales Family XIII bacterium]
MGAGTEVYEGFVTAAVVAPALRPGNCRYNATKLFEEISAAEAAGASLVCAPELSITGYTCGDLFLQETLLDEALAALRALVRSSAKSDVLFFAGLPVSHMGKLYNVAAAVSGGRLLGLVPKTYHPNYGEFYELRHFTPAPSGIEDYSFEGGRVPFGTDLLFRCAELPEFAVAAEICEDLWTPLPPSTRHARAGATVIVNLSAGDETIGKDEYRRLLIKSQSGRAVCAYLYANAGYGESTGDMVFSGHGLICENASLLAERKPFEANCAIADIDVKSLARDRRYLNTFTRTPFQSHKIVMFSQAARSALRYRHIDPHPFVPAGDAERAARCEGIIRMQTSGLMRRLEHTKSEKAVIGLSGGLDSTLALLIAARAAHALGWRGEDILAVTMPGPGTTQMTKRNAELLAAALGVGFKDIDIGPSVRQHLRDIGHPEDEHNNVYENAQARIRTLILMDLANKFGGIVVGTGDLSELALGWTTYNGDHMSMYGVNAGVPKTLVRYIIGHIADAEPRLSGVLRAVLGTPVSPELLPPEDGRISQKTEELIGPYELHDFFLYHALRRGRTPALILKLAGRAFAGKYTASEIRATLRLFYRRFFANQFKRSALPDGPKIGSVTLSPRADLRMPSDADGEAWIRGR